MALPGIGIENAQLDFGSSATGGTFGNISGSNYGGGARAWMSPQAMQQAGLPAWTMPVALAAGVVAVVVYLGRR